MFAVYRIWWKTAEEAEGSEKHEDLGQHPVDAFSYNELQEQLDGLAVTHVRIEGSIPDHIYSLAPNLTHFSLCDCVDSDWVEKYVHLYTTGYVHVHRCML